MKSKKVIISVVLLCLSIVSFSQTKLNIGGGYFGETVTYPGIVVEFEYEKFHTEKFSTPFKVNVGFYNHQRNHNALFLDLHEGFRRYFKEGKWYFEQSIGLGLMLSFYNEDVWHVDDNGNVARVSNVGNLDFMPSVTFGFGYNLTQKKKSDNYIWARPKIFWQMPFNNLAYAHLALQIGYTYNFKTK